MQKCVIGGYLQIQQKSGALVLSSQQAGLGAPIGAFFISEFTWPQVNFRC